MITSLLTLRADQCLEATCQALLLGKPSAIKGPGSRVMALFIGGIPVDWSINSSKKKFEESEIYRYLNEVFLKEMLQPGLVIDKSFTEKSNVEKSAVQFVKKM